MDISDLDMTERQVWLRAFYGFDPEGAGYIGFTHEGQRRDMMEKMRNGDLVLIYGAVEDLTDRDLRAQALGFLEVELEECVARDRMSDDSYQWKVDHQFEDRWNYGIKVRKAWRVRNRVGIGSIAPKACESKNRFTRTTKAILLEPEERERALSHTVFQVNVFGEPPIPSTDLREGTMEAVLKPSRGIVPGLGERSSNYVDGDNWLYLMILTVSADAFLTKGSAVFGDALVKVGRTNDVARRLDEVNCGFPERASFRWKAIAKHKFPSAGAAHAAECELKEDFARRFRSQGNEFFSGNHERLIEAFQSFCAASVPRILGAPAKARGI